MKAHELLTDPKRWTQGAPARDAAGVEVSEHDKSAVCWCMMGAIIKCYGGSFAQCNKQFNKVADKLEELYGNPQIHKFNDCIDTTHEQVVSLLKELDV